MQVRATPVGPDGRLGPPQTNMNTVFRLVNPGYDMDTYIFKG